MPSLSRVICAALLLFWTASAAAETKVGFRQITVVEPVAVQRGTSGQVTLRSNFTLDGTHAVFLEPPGIEMTFAETKPIDAPRRGRASDGTPFRFDITVPEDQLPGVYELRVATDQAVSSVSHLMVTDWPVVREDEKQDNGSLSSAMTVEYPVAICGRIEKMEDVDYYRFHAPAGADLSMEIHAQRVTEGIHGMVVRGPLIYLMDSLLTLYGPNGQVIAQNDNFIGGDACIHAVLPEEGEYVLEVRDARYAGSGRYVYCVEISDRPRIDTVFPMAVQRGTSVQPAVIGRRFGSPSAIEISAASDAPLGWRRERLTTEHGPSNPVEVLVSEVPQVIATSQNQTLESALPVELPVGANGWLREPGEQHCYTFSARKGEAYRFELFSHRRDLPMDGVLELYDANGKRLVESDDLPFTKDPRLDWQAPADGEYRLLVRDLHDRGGERFVYHLTMEPAGPDFELSGEYYYAQIAPGTNMIWFAKIKRLHGFDGPVEIQVDNLPQGVSCVPATIPAGMNHCSLILMAAQDAPINASLVHVIGKAKVQDADGQTKELIRRGLVTCEQQGSGGGQARWPIKTQLVGVTKPLDLLSVSAEPSELTLKPGESAEINVTIVRNEGFTDPVTLAMSFDYFSTKFGEQLPPGVTVSKKSQLRLSGKTLSGKVILEASDKAVPVTRLPIAVLARVSITFSITTNYCSNPIFLTIPAAKE